MFTVTDAINDTFPRIDPESRLFGGIYRGVVALVSNPIVVGQARIMSSHEFQGTHSSESWIRVLAAYAYIRRNLM